MASLAPHHPESVGALSNVIGGFHAFDIEKCPQRLTFPL
jgi:hypothetical protein